MFSLCINWKKLDESEMKDNLLCGEHKRRDAKCLLQAVSTVVELSALVFHDSTVPRTAFANYPLYLPTNILIQEIHTINI